LDAKGMGWSDMNAHLKIPKVNCIALADIDSKLFWIKESEDVMINLRGKKPQLYKDYRKMLRE
jgi:hypothetical protein